MSFYKSFRWHPKTPQLLSQPPLPPTPNQSLLRSRPKSPWRNNKISKPSWSISWWEECPQLSPRLSPHPLRSSSSDSKTKTRCLRMEPSPRDTPASWTAETESLPRKESELSGKETSPTCSDTSPPKPWTSPSRTTSRECSTRTRTETDISPGSSETSPQEDSLDPAHSSSSTLWTTPEPDSPTTWRTPRRVEPNNSQDSSTSTRRPSPPTVSSDSTEDSSSPASVSSSTEVSTSVSTTPSRLSYQPTSRTTSSPTSPSDGSSPSELVLLPTPSTPSEEEWWWHPVKPSSTTDLSIVPKWSSPKRESDHSSRELVLTS